AEWPDGVLPDSSSPLVIGVNGGNESFLEILRALASGKFAGTHPLEVKSVGSIEEMKTCQIVFFRSSGSKSIRAAVEGVGRGVLFMGEDESFLEEGGMINLFRDRGSVQFEVNADALDRSDIHFSAKILALAKAKFVLSRTALSNSQADGIRQE